MHADPTMESHSHFKDLLAVFGRHKVRFLVVGGYAVMLYTEPRWTKDLDLWVDTAGDNAERVFAALCEFGAPLSARIVDRSVAVRPNSIDAINRDAPHATDTPAIKPNASSPKVSRITSHTTFPRRAPRAIRTPSSLVRRATV